MNVDVFLRARMCVNFSTGSQTGCALKRHWIFRMAIYIQYGLCCPSPAPWVQSDVPSEVAKRLCDVSAVAPGTSHYSW